MTDQLITSVTTVVMAIIGVAILSVLVSRNAQTGSVLNAGGNALSNVLSAAMGPIAGGGIRGVSFTGGGAGIGIGITG